MNNKEKMQKYLQRDFELMFLLYLIFGIISLFTFSGSSIYLFLFVILRLAIVIGLWFGSRDAKNGKKSAGIDGIVFGILMVFSNNLFTLLLGIILCIHSIVYLVNYNKFK